jgi:hypothetical protein
MSLLGWDYMLVGLVPLRMAMRTSAPVFFRALAMGFDDVGFFVLDIVFIPLSVDGLG